MEPSGSDGGDVEVMEVDSSSSPEPVPASTAAPEPSARLSLFYVTFMTSILSVSHILFSSPSNHSSQGQHGSKKLAAQKKKSSVC